MHLNPNLIFLLKDGHIMVWDYQNHTQSILDKEYLERLLDCSKSKIFDQNSLDQHLINAHLLLENPEREDMLGWDLLSYIFHTGSSNMEDQGITPEKWFEDYLKSDPCKDKPDPALPTNHIPLDLPPPKSNLFQFDNLLDVLYRRKTCRFFYGRSINLEQLSTLLYYSFGEIHQNWPARDDNFRRLVIRKAFPSAGGIHPEKAYILAFRVDDLDPGIYTYSSKEHQLNFIAVGSFESQTIDLLYNQFHLHGLALGVFITISFDKIWDKFRNSRSYRFALFDVGHASQTFLLTATALGCHTLLSGSFNDQRVRKFLRIENKFECPFLFIGAGYGSNESLHPDLLAR